MYGDLFCNNGLSDNCFVLIVVAEEECGYDKSADISGKASAIWAY